MHVSSMKNMSRCCDMYLFDLLDKAGQKIRVLDIGGADINGSYADYFRTDQFEYVAVDLEPGPGVHHVLEDPYKLPFEDGAFDLVISGQVFEHCEMFWLSFDEMMRVNKDDGFVFLIAPSAGPIHRFPVDCYRFYPDAYRALAKYNGCHLVDVWHDQYGPWNDLVGVYSKTHREKRPRPIFAQKAEPYKGPSSVEDEIVRDALPAADALAAMAQALAPRSVLDIAYGEPLAIEAGTTIHINPNLKTSDGRNIKTYSDEFFEFSDHPILSDPIDFIAIRGKNTFEDALRDFINAEKQAHKFSVIAIEGVLPNTEKQGARQRQTQQWSGDVWKMIPFLKQKRPDLVLMEIDAAPSGLLLVLCPSPGHSLIRTNYNPFVRIQKNSNKPPAPAILKRVRAMSPDDPRVSAALLQMKQLRTTEETGNYRNQIRKKLSA